MGKARVARAVSCGIELAGTPGATRAGDFDGWPMSFTGCAGLDTGRLVLSTCYGPGDSCSYSGAVLVATVPGTFTLDVMGMVGSSFDAVAIDATQTSIELLATGTFNTLEGDTTALSRPVQPGDWVLIVDNVTGEEPPPIAPVLGAPAFENLGEGLAG